MLSNRRPSTRNLQPAPAPNGDGFDVEAMPPPGRALQRMQTSYATAIAVQVPRDLREVEAAVVDEAKAAGEDFFYCWTVMSRNPDTNEPEPSLVRGMSIDGAMSMIRNWTNASLEIDIAEETPSSWTIRAVFVDLEKGFTLPRLFRQRKGNAVAGRYDDERKLDMAFQVAQSKATRNVVEKAMPGWLVRKAIEAASGEAEKYVDLPKALAKARGFARSRGIPEPAIEKRMGKPLEKFLPSDHVTLAAISRAIAAGETTVAQEFGGAPDATATSEPKVPPTPPPTPPPQNETRTATAAAAAPAGKRTRDPGEDEE